MGTGRHELQLRAKLTDGRVVEKRRSLVVARRLLKSKKEHAPHHEKPVAELSEAEPVSETTASEEPASSEPEAVETSTEELPSGSGLVLDAGFENGLWNWNTAGVGDVAPSVVSDIVRSGSKAAKFELNGSQTRSELILGGDGTANFNPVKFTEGSEFYYGFSFYIESMDYGHPGAHNVIMQFKSEGPGSPNFDLSLWNYEGHKGLWSEGDAMGGGNRFLAPVAERAWHDVVIHFRASSQESGFYELFLDGTLIDARSNVSMIVPGHNYAYIKNGIYRGSELTGTSQLRVDAAKLGTSAAAVLPG